MNTFNPTFYSFYAGGQKAIFTFFFLLTTCLQAAERPNVLLVSIDDLNDWVGVLGGHPQAQTPNIDRLAKMGTLFSNAHCQSPVCNPSRASMMTGRYPHTSGIYFLSPDLADAPVLKDVELFLRLLLLRVTRRWRRERFFIGATSAFFRNTSQRVVLAHAQKRKFPSHTVTLFGIGAPIRKLMKKCLI